MSQPADWASGTLGYRFQDVGLLEQALTHRSVSGGNSVRGGNNERLEFLGDAVLGLVMAEAVYGAHPGADEGTLSRLRARLVRRETLEELARQMALGDLVRLGGGELRSGGHRRGSILANALEAVFGAVFLDGGWVATRSSVLKVLGPRLAALQADDELRDPKTRLQELLQAEGHPLPTYDVEQVSGSAHAQQFAVVCRLATPGLEVRGEGASRRAAEQQAAEKALLALNDDA